MPAITVLIAHSQRLLADALARALAPLPDIKVLAEHPKSGLVAVDVAELFRPDVALVDYWLEEMQGPAVVQAIRSCVPRCKSIVLSWFHGPAEIENSLAAGAVGFLPQSLGVDEITEAIRRAQAGESPVYGNELAGMVKLIQMKEAASQDVWRRLKTLTRRELEILALLSLGTQPKAIADMLVISLKTVRNHINNMMEKTATHSQGELLSVARDQGLIAG